MTDEGKALQDDDFQGFEDEDAAKPSSSSSVVGFKSSSFKCACAVSWLVILFTCAAFVVACVAVGGLSSVQSELCAEPEIVNLNSTCRDAVKAFNDCIDQSEVIHSVQMRSCFLVDGTAAAYSQSTALYMLAMRRVLSGDAVTAVVEPDERAPFAYAEAHGARTLAEADDDEKLLEAYNNLAAASLISLIVSGTLSHVYGWFATVCFLAMLPALFALYALGNAPPRCCVPSRRVESMHQGSMRCACRCSYCLGLGLVIFASLALAKFQILLRYHDVGIELTAIFSASSNSTQAASAMTYHVDQFGYTASVAVLPCILGIVGGVTPILLALLLTCTMPERRDAMAKDLPLKLYKEKPGKELTAPYPELPGAPINLAMLNPDTALGSTPGGSFEPSYMSNYGRGGAKAAARETSSSCLELSASVPAPVSAVQSNPRLERV